MLGQLILSFKLQIEEKIENAIFYNKIILLFTFCLEGARKLQ